MLVNVSDIAEWCLIETSRLLTFIGKDDINEKRSSIRTPCTTYVYKCLILNFEKYILQRNFSVHTMYTLLMSYLIREITIEYGLQNKAKYSDTKSRSQGKHLTPYKYEFFV